MWTANLELIKPTCSHSFKYFYWWRHCQKIYKKKHKVTRMAVMHYGLLQADTEILYCICICIQATIQGQLEVYK